MSNPLWSHGLQHARLPCPSLPSRVCSNSCPSSRWCQPTMSSSVAPLSSYPQSFPASGSFAISRFFASGGQSSGASASASVLPMNIQGWFPLGLTCFFCCNPRDAQEFFPTLQLKKSSVFWCSAFFMVQLSHQYMTTWKIMTFYIQTFVVKVMSLLFNTLSRFVTAFLPRCTHLIISWLQSPSTVILKPKNMKSVTVSIVSHLFAMKWWDQIPWS